MLDICRVPISEHNSVGEEDGSEKIVKVDHFMVLSPKDDVTEPSGITNIKRMKVNGPEMQLMRKRRVVAR